MNEKLGFFKNHADTVAIIGVNIALAAIMMSMWVSNTHRVDAANARMDSVHTMIYDMMKETRNGR